MRVMTVELVTIPDVELAATGTHHLKTGDTVIDRDDLVAALEAAEQDPAVLYPRAKLAHEKQLDTGEPSFGVAANLRLRDDPDGSTKLLGDWVGCPKWLADVAPAALPNRSIEGERNWTSPSGKTHRLVISAFGLLGVTMPGIKGLKDLATWYGPSTPKGVILAAYGDATQIDDPKKESIVPFPKAYMEKLGLAEDAADDVVLAKLDELEKAAKGDPDAIKLQVDAAVAAAADAARVKAETDAQAAAQSKIDDARKAALDELKEQGLTVVDGEALAKLQADATAGAEIAASAADAKRKGVIEAAIGKGKIAPSRREHFVSALESGAIDEATIDALPENVVPVAQRGATEDALVASQGDASGLGMPESWYSDAELKVLREAGRLPA